MSRTATLALVLLLASFQTEAGALLPEPEDFRSQKIERQAGEADWPFVEQKGLLMCVKIFGIKHVQFHPGELDEYAFDEDPLVDPAIVNVTTDPIQLWTDPVANEHLVPGMTIEEKIRRMGPYVTFGKKLCDQPKGAMIGPGEL
jgi:hypothetical protein